MVLSGQRGVPSRSPELHHPVPTHPPYEIPEPPGTPVIASSTMNEHVGQPGGYMRYTSPPPPHGSAQQQPLQSTSPYGRNVPAYGVPPPQAYQSFSGGASGAVPPPLQGQMNSGHPNQPPPPMMPNLNAWGVNDVTAQMGMQFGQSAIAAGQNYMEKNVSPSQNDVSGKFELANDTRSTGCCVSPSVSS